jgi:ribosomal 50S subunit-recycling heat shock protein
MNNEVNMRLDKYLKVSRIIKRRTVANEVCDAGHVVVSGRVVKASYDVKEGDILEIQFGEKVAKYKVLNVTEHATKQTASDMYEIVK